MLRRVRSSILFKAGYPKKPLSREWWKPTLHRAISTQVMPKLLKEREDGSEERIEEKELFEYSRYRWLCDNNENVNSRYRKFNVSAIIDAAIAAVNNGAKSCTKLLKCVEGQYNKAFVMTMDNGYECVAKIPNPNAGPKFYLTASEVATRHFLREVLGLPIPRIISYSSSNENAVGAEYIIEEKADGISLRDLWYQSTVETQRSIVAQIVGFETKLTSMSFNRHGCIYYRSDIEKMNIRNYPIVEQFEFLQGQSSNVDATLIKKFVIGPLTEAKLWEGEREIMKLDRGPWSSCQSYMTTMGINEIEWADQHAKPRINPRRSLEKSESPSGFISLIERYLQITPFLAPKSTRTTLSHNDLHLDNIFVDPKSMQITSVIDWQSASICEPLFQQAFPRMLQPVQGTEIDKPNEQHLKGRANLNYYNNLAQSQNRQHWNDLNAHDRTFLTRPVNTLCGAWQRNDVFSFRDSLIEVAARWKEIAKNREACPINFTTEELEAHREESEIIEGLSTVLHQLQDENLLPLGGMVHEETYEASLRINNHVKDMFVDSAQSEAQRELHSRIWPY